MCEEYMDEISKKGDIDSSCMTRPEGHYNIVSPYV